MNRPEVMEGASLPLLVGPMSGVKCSGCTCHTRGSTEAANGHHKKTPGKFTIAKIVPAKLAAPQHKNEISHHAFPLKKTAIRLCMPSIILPPFNMTMNKHTTNGLLFLTLLRNKMFICFLGSPILIHAHVQGTGTQ